MTQSRVVERGQGKALITDRSGADRQPPTMMEHTKRVVSKVHREGWDFAEVGGVTISPE